MDSARAERRRRQNNKWNSNKKGENTEINAEQSHKIVFSPFRDSSVFGDVNSLIDTFLVALEHSPVCALRWF